MHAIGQFDHDHADVAHHGEQHLAEAFGLRFLAVLELDLIEFADPIHQFCHDLPEDAGDFGLGGGRILDDVVQYRGDQSVGVETQIREDVGDRDGVGDVGFARDPLLALMLLGAEIVGFANPLYLGRGQVGLELVEELTDPGGASSTG